MILLKEKHFEKIYWAFCSAVLVMVVLRCIKVPFSHDEVATFYFYIQPGDFLPFLSHADANGHFLTSLLTWISFKLAGSSTLALRLPCIGAYLLLTYSVFKINKLLHGLAVKIIFTSAFIFSFNFINFYSLCRGYGLSMALLMLALYYFFVHIKFGSFTHYYKFLLFSQLALSANLTLVFVLALTSGVVLFFQIRNKSFFQAKYLIVLLLHLALLIYWIKYAFFLQQNGALYYGSGESYWKVTFESLIETIFFKSLIFNYLSVLAVSVMSGYFVFRLYKEKFNYLFGSFFSLSFVCLCGLVLAFYLLKKLMHVNYPEDRTGLFFYVFFMLTFCFMLGELSTKVQLFFMLIPVFFIAHFYKFANTSAHAWRVYETMPQSFFDILVKEQKAADHPITIAGHRVREFFYGFLNYNSAVKLNHMTSPEALQMNCDYALAYTQDKPYYDKYYSELAQDKYWNFVLLKRKTSIEKKLIWQSKDTGFDFNANLEYYNAFERLDTSLAVSNPLQAEFRFSVDQVPIPFNAWFVLEVTSADLPDSNVFIRVPLNLIKYDWNGSKSFTTCLVSGNIPLKIKRMVAYLWNIDKKEIKIHLQSFKLYQLQGEGITYQSSAKL